MKRRALAAAGPFPGTLALAPGVVALALFPAPGRAQIGTAEYLLEALEGSAVRSAALDPAVVARIELSLGDLPFEGRLPDGEAVFGLPVPVDRLALELPQVVPAGGGERTVAVTRLLAGRRVWGPERLSAFESFPSRLAENGQRVASIESDCSVTVPLDRAGAGGQLVLQGEGLVEGGRFRVTARVDGQDLPRRIVRTGAQLLPWFQLPDALGLQQVELEFVVEDPGTRLSVAGIELAESGGRDRIAVRDWNGQEGLMVAYAPAPPGPALPLSLALPSAAADFPRSLGQVLLLPGLASVWSEAPVPLELRMQGALLPVQGTSSREVAFGVPRLGLGEVRLTGAPLAASAWLLQPAALWQRPLELFNRGSEPAEPLHPLVHHHMLGNETRRVLFAPVPTTWELEIAAGGEGDVLAAELAAVDLFPAELPPPGTRLHATLALPGGAQVSLAPVAVESLDRWASARIPLPARPPGSRLRLSVDEDPRAPALSRLRGALLGDPRILHRGGPRRPNLIVYLIDTLRADRLGCLGQPRPLTPHLDALARDGVLFREAQSAAPWTRPSVATTFTGLLPQFHNVDYSRGLSAGFRTLAEEFRAAGYATAGFSANAQVHAAGLDFEQGFSLFVSFQRPEGVLSAADEVHGPAHAWIEEHREQPFFLFLHTIDPHYPYAPPESTRGTYSKDYTGTFREDPPAAVARLDPRDLAPEDLQYLVDCYDEEVLFNDAWFGELVTLLKRLDLYDDTAILFLSDHGEEFLDHGGLGHCNRLFNELLHVPMILKLPGADAPRGVRVDAMVRTLDVLPTMVQMFDLAPQDRGYQGRNLAPLWQGGEDEPRWSIALETQPPLQSIQSGSWKLILAGESGDLPARKLLYHVAEDPREQHDLSAARPDVVAALERQLENLLADLEARGFSRDEKGSEAELTSGLRSALEQLGYLER